jgi:hypothetical protein
MSDSRNATKTEVKLLAPLYAELRQAQAAPLARINALVNVLAEECGQPDGSGLNQDGTWTPPQAAPTDPPADPGKGKEG